MSERVQGGIAGFAVCVAMAIVIAFCTPPSGPNPPGVNGGSANDELLWLATFGDSENGSHSRSGNRLVINWRARDDFRFDPQAPDGMAAGELFDVDGLYQCQSTVGGEPAMTLVDLTKVYLFDQDGRPFTDLQLVDAAPDVTVEFPQGNIDEDDVDTEEGAAAPPTWPSVDDILFGDFANEGPIVPVPAIRLSPEQRFQPTPELFARDVDRLLELAPEGTRIGVDFALTPTMIYAAGGEDPTPVPEGTVSSLFESQATADVDPGLVWIADHPLPADDDSTRWPEEIDQANSDRGQSRPSGYVTPEYGHSLMVASAAAQTSPGTTLRVVDATNPSNHITVSALDAALKRSEILDSGPSVLNLSFGAYDCDLSELGLPDQELATSLEAVLRPYIDSADVAVVAAAGNDGSPDPFYPASLAGVLAVGATDSTVINTESCLAGDAEAWTPADDAADPDCRLDPNQLARFSNRAADIDRGAPGTDLILDYPTFETGPELVYEYLNDEDPSDRVTASLGQRVRISGTSFAAPLVSACLAAGRSDGACAWIVENADIDFTVPTVG